MNKDIKTKWLAAQRSGEYPHWQWLDELEAVAWGDKPLSEAFLIWWTNQNDCERIAPLDSWPTWLYDEFQSRSGRNGRGRLWVPPLWANDAPDGVSVEWDAGKNWLCRAANDAGGIVIPKHALRHVQFLPGFITTFDMALPADQ